jgi:hypothetical protein
LQADERAAVTEQHERIAPRFLRGRLPDPANFKRKPSIVIWP